MKVCLEKAREMFDITEENIPTHNSRLRLFNPISEMKLETYTGKENSSLEELKVGSYKSFLL